MKSPATSLRCGDTWTWRSSSPFYVIEVFISGARIILGTLGGREGSKKQQERLGQPLSTFLSRGDSNPPKGYKCEQSDEEVEADAKRLLEQLESSGSLDLRTTYVSCWHENETESEALWRLYCPPPTAGTALRTTFADLKRAFDDDSLHQNWARQICRLSNSIRRPKRRNFQKRKSLQHEQEVRAVIRNRAADESTGLMKQVELSALIKEVVVSPFSPGWLESIVRDLLKRYDVPVPIRTSELLSQPFL